VDRHAQIALLHQDLDRLCGVREPRQIDGWQPSTEQRLVYAKLLGSILNQIDKYRCEERRYLLRDGRVQVDVSGSARIGQK
jgi:hypothetical protein